MALRGVAGQANTSTSTSVVVTVSGIGGTGPQLNDVVLFFMNGGGNFGNAALTPPSGFSAVPGISSQLVGGAGSQGSVRVMCWYKVAGASEPSTYTATSDTNDFQTAEVWVYSGRNTSSPFTAVATTSNNATNASPITLAFTGLTAAAGDDIAVLFGNSNWNTNAPSFSVTPPSGFADSNVFFAASTAFTPPVLGFDEVNASAGATGTLGGTETFSGPTDASYGGYVLSLASGGAAAAAPANWSRSRPLPGRGPGKTRFLRATPSFSAASIGVLAGNSDLLIGQTGALTGSGALAGTTALAFNQTGVVTGAGVLSGTAGLLFGETGAITGTGVLAGTSALLFAQTAALTGAGALSGTSALTFGQTGTLIQPGLNGTAALLFGQSGTLTASGVLAGSSALQFGQTAALAAAGALAGASALTIGQAATLTAVGILSGASALTFAQTASLAATGALAGASALTFGASATADLPAGALQGTAGLSFVATGTATGFGALIGACQILINAQATADQQNTQAGPVDSPRISDTAFRRKKKLRKIETPAEPVFIAPASFEREIPPAIIAKATNFQSLADITGKPVATLRAQVDHEIESLMRAHAERDDEEALEWILKALD